MQQLKTERFTAKIVFDRSHFQKELEGLRSCTFLLACSGGLDSTVLAHLFYQEGLRFELLHLNYKLRGEESDSEARFVEKLGKTLQIPAHVREFQITKKTGVQEQAREARYKYFEEMLVARSADWVVVAHHRDDLIETSLIHWVRGAHFQQWKSLGHRDKILRPLLRYTRKDLTNYALSQGISWREDSSNRHSDYLRNFIRNQWVPELQKHLEGTLPRLLYSAEMHHRQWGVLDAYKTRLFQELSRIQGDLYYFNIERILELSPLEGHLELLFSEWGSWDWKTLERLLRAENGKATSNQHFRLVKYRDDLILAPLSRAMPFKRLEVKDWELEPTRNIPVNAQLVDAQKVKDPLVLRPWKTTDSIQIKKGKVRKPLAKYLRELQLDPLEKEQIQVVVHKEQVVWIVGYDLDSQFEVSSNTTAIKLIQCF